MAPPVTIRDLRFDWPGGRFGLDVPAFDLPSGAKMMLTGASGAGKSTLLALICGIVQPQAGRVDVAGQPMSGLPPRARDRLRADQIGIIFQQFNLLPYATALDNICLPLRFSPRRRAQVSNPRDDALSLTQALGLPDDLVLRAKSTDLSVGQQQRVAVARALLGAPPLIVADEPTSALDVDAQAEFLDLLFAQVTQMGASLLMVSHDPALAPRFDIVQPLAKIAMPRRGAA
ncbi:MAG: ABC transporter ATP-binding protein [Rhodobacteraceae bacterium]|nr:ABC transporter ATP-binding protein [Paracoccaceae bacterium]